MNNNQDLIKTQELYQQIRQILDSAKQSAIVQVNQTLVLAYWNVGKVIKNEIVNGERAKYGEQTIQNTATRLVQEYGGGFSKRNLFRMVEFYEKFNEFKIVATLSAQLSWSHFVELLAVKDNLSREFYLTMAINEKCSVRVLRERINSMLFERSSISKLPEQTIKHDLDLLNNEQKMSPSLFLRDPYLLDFLEIKDSYSEKDLENAILAELESFILEFGSDFAFMARQKRIQIGNDDYKLDLLFYHRKLKRLVLIELKLGKFQPAYKGQVELYLRYLSKYEKQDGEEEPLAIILCADKNQEVIELLDLSSDNIHIAEYWLKLPKKELLQQKLHKAIANATARMEAQEGLCND